MRMLLMFVIALGTATLAAPDGEEEKPFRPKVGAYYFDGWSGQTNDHHLTERLKTEFAHREPVWGWFDNTVPIMEQQIDYAADNDLAFFAFCWYWPEGKKKESPLNNALGLYLQAKNRSRMEFALLVANHAGFRIGPNDWDAVGEKWIALFKEPGHLTVNGAPLLIIFSPAELLKSFGSPAAVRKAFDALREKARAAGLKGVTVAACTLPSENLDELVAAGFDIFTGYAWPQTGARKKGKDQSYADLAPGHEKIWNTFARKKKAPCIPLVTAGWDMRPWERPNLPEEKRSVCYPDRTPEEVGRFVERAIAWTRDHRENVTAENLIILYAWNENGEGGYLTPTKSDGDALLKAVGAAIRK